MGYNIRFEHGDYLCHKSHKYIDKKWSNGRWNYIYEEGQKKSAKYDTNIPDTAHVPSSHTHGYHAYDTNIQTGGSTNYVKPGYALVPAVYDPNKDKIKEAAHNAHHHGHTVQKETYGAQKQQVTHGPHGENVGSNIKEHEPKKEQSTFDKIKESGKKAVYHLIEKLTGKPHSMSTYVKEHIKGPYIKYLMDYDGNMYNPARHKKSK